MASEYEEGLLVGLLIGEGHFGGDGRQPHVTLRMHTRHSALMRWIERTFPGGRVYGPYNHGGREYLQWMARGSFLREEVLPVLERRIAEFVDTYSWERFERMRTTYRRQLGKTAPPESATSDLAHDERGPHLSGGGETFEDGESPGAGGEPRSASDPAGLRADQAFASLRQAFEDS